MFVVARGQDFLIFNIQVGLVLILTALFFNKKFLLSNDAATCLVAASSSGLS